MPNLHGTSLGGYWHKPQQQQAELVLVAPVRRAQVWYPVLLEMLVEIPLLVPQREDLIHAPRDPTKGNPPTSRVGYLRQRYQDCQISEEATSIMEAEVLQDIRFTLWEVDWLV